MVDGDCVAGFGVDGLGLDEFWFAGCPAVMLGFVAPAVVAGLACPCAVVVVAQGATGIVGFVDWLGGVVGVGTGDVGVGGV